jgi:hypothetical protein
VSLTTTLAKEPLAIKYGFVVNLVLESICVAVTLCTSVRGVFGSNVAWVPAILTEILRDFLAVLANSGTIPFNETYHYNLNNQYFPTVLRLCKLCC